jgi:hypothetical protein
MSDHKNSLSTLLDTVKAALICEKTQRLSLVNPLGPWKRPGCRKMILHFTKEMIHSKSGPTLAFLCPEWLPVLCLYFSWTSKRWSPGDLCKECPSLIRSDSRQLYALHDVFLFRLKSEKFQAGIMIESLVVSIFQTTEKFS